jgi:TP901 family phage tail tape measure protein
MTSIWNNFDNGVETLESYADKITALGAATASSSEEIAGGLEKFAAIANTIGLSYEYATSALATVVSATRQSEETVGTAFKTIFGRMQSLNLGETLDDGVNLTKYSAALKTVGIDVLGANN